MSGKLNYPRQIETCEPGASRTIFDGPGQHVDNIDPSSIKLLSDRCLIRDIPQDDSQRGSLVIPEVAQRDGVGKGGLLRIGLVIAVGPGDQFHEMGLDAQGDLRRKLITTKCQCCDPVDHTVGEMRSDGSCWDVPCSECDGSGRIPVTVPAQCNPGDKVIFDRRREAEFIVNGERLCMIHAEQSILAVLED